MKNNRTKVMVFGTFDGLHEGHINFFKQAKNLTESPFLIVGIARDKNVYKIKGFKPLFKEKERLNLVKECTLVDKVVLSGLTKHIPHIVKERPDIIALGYDQRDYVKNLKKDLENKGLIVKIVRLRSFKKHIYKNRLLHTKGRSASGGKK